MSVSLLDTHFEHLESLLNALNKLFSSKLKEEIKVHSDLLKSLHTAYISLADRTEPQDGAEKEELFLRYHTENLDLLEKHFTSISLETFLNEVIKDFSNELEDYLEGIPGKLSLESAPDDFQVHKGDPLRIRAGLYLTRIFNRSGKKNDTNTTKLSISVHYRNLIRGYLLPLYFEAITGIVKESQVMLINSYLQIFIAEHEMIQNNYSVRQEELAKFTFSGKNQKLKGLGNFFQEHRPELSKYILRSGLRLSSNPLQNLGKRLDYNKSREGLVKMNRSWQSTFFALFEDWRLHERLFAYLNRIHLAHLNMEEIYTRRIESSLFPEVETQLKYTSSLMQRLPDPDVADMESIRTFFLSELYRLKKEKTNEDQKAQLLQVVEDIPKLLHKLENEVRENLDIFPEKAGVVGNPKYLAGIKSSEIFYFYPAEFIEFQYLNNYCSRLAQHRTDLGKELSVIINEFNEYDQIIDFYLDSTISLTERSGMNEAEIITFFRDGLQRLLNISNRISDLLKILEKQKLEEVSALTSEYLDHITELDNNDNIISLYTRLLKSKALAESRTHAQKLTGFLKGMVSKTSGFIKKQGKWFQSSYSDIKKRLRLDSSTEPISSDISNYLTNIQKRIYKLPLIYQHLFENMPVREFNMFLSREEEINKLHAAYNDWIKDNFAASLITGENGSGKSSLLHYYSKTLKTNYKILHFTVEEFYYTEDDYYRLIRGVFAQEELVDDASISSHISSFTERRIIIMDGLERLFIRKVNGFACLQKLLSLIVSSNQKIFWICSVSKYASAYLNKTAGLSEYFDYIIDIDTLNNRQIRDIVLKRNRLSGYELSYQKAIVEDDQAKSKNLTESEIEDRFFAELNRLAGSNISLSLTYWLQSVQTFKEDRIEIGPLHVPEFGFLESISPEKAYTLLVVVMHGKITLDLHAQIFNQPAEKSYRILSILKEDSILIMDGEYFILNGILLRHVLRMLANRNLIH